MRIKRISVQIVPMAYDDEVIELRVDVHTQYNRYGYCQQIPADHFEELFERIMKRATYEIKEKTFDVSDISAQKIKPEEDK